MATQPIPLGTSDITVYGKDPLDSTYKTYGYFFSSGTDIRENRGDAFIGAFGTGDSTYQDAEPFKRRVWTNWNGGMGQVSADHKEGGAGNGGDDAKYFDGSTFTKKGNILMPGLMRKNRYGGPVATAGVSKLLASTDTTYYAENALPQHPAPLSHPAGALAKFNISDGVIDTFTRSGAIGSSETTGGYTAQAYSATQGTWTCNGTKATNVTTDANGDFVQVSVSSTNHPDYEVSCDMSGTVVSSTTYRIPILAGRINGTSYIMAYNWQNKLYVDKVVSGVNTNLTNSIAWTKADGANITIKLSFIGSTLNVYLDGSSTAAYTTTLTDAVLLTGTTVGLKVSKALTPATAVSFDNLLVNPIIKTIRLLGKVDDQSVGSYTVTASIGTTTSAGTYNLSGSATISVEFKWFNLSCSDSKGYITLTPGNWYLRVAYNSNVVFGGYIGTLDSTSNVLIPYWQIVINSLNPYDVSGMNSLIGVYRLYSSTYTMFVNAYVTNNAVYGRNMNATGLTGGLLGITTTVLCAIIFDNKLWISTTNGVYSLAADDIHDANSATLYNAAPKFGTMVVGNNKVFCTDQNGRIVYSWQPNTAYNATTNPLAITGTDVVGSGNANGRNPINRLFVYRGLLYAFKPEGVFLFYADPDKITTNGSTRIEKIVNFASHNNEDLNNGKYVVEYQGQLVFNVLDDIWLLAPGANGNNITIVSPPLMRSNGQNISYIDGIQTNGQELYISLQSFGIWVYDGSWHRVAYYYETVNPTSRGLTYLPQDLVDGVVAQIYFLDGYGVYYQAMPSTTDGSYLKQIYKNDQSKFAYWISSLETMDLAEVTKYLHSWTIKAASQGYNIKVQAAIYQTGSGQPNFRLITEQTFNQGLWRDTWSGSNAVAPYRTSDLAALAYPVVVPGNCYFTDSDFSNEKSIAEKTVSTDYVTNPTTIVQCQFIVFMWKANGLQYDSNNLYTEIAYIDAMVLKFLPILDYIPLYHLVVDAQILFDDGSLNVAAVNDSMRFLRAMSQSRTPIKFQFYDVTGAVKTIIGYMQNVAFSTDAITVVEGDPPAKTCQFDILSIQGEPVN